MLTCLDPNCHPLTHLCTHLPLFLLRFTQTKYVLSPWQVEVISKSQAMLGPTAKLQTLGRTVIETSPGVPAAAQSPLRVPSRLPAGDRDRPLELQEVVSEEEEGRGEHHQV